MSYDSTLFNADPYYDDFKESKKFLRVMFKPGFALQAREVTQLQTILQNQIERFGSHVFENGSPVIDGQITENYLRYGRIGGLSGISSITSMIGSVIGAPNRAQAKIIHVEGGLSSSTVDPYSVVFFEYTQGGITFGTNDVVSGTASNQPFSFSFTGQSTSPSLGDSTVISVNSGVRFVDGYFVLHDAQMIAASTLTGSIGTEYRIYENPTTRIGFKANKSFVNANEDNSLNDPAFGYYNYSAPGADRFKIDLGLTQCEFIPTSVNDTTNFANSDFMEIIRIVDGEVIKKETYPEYAALEDTFARRTYDESGNYTVDPFDLNTTYRNTTGITGATLSAELGPGKAYVFGYEFETQGTNVLALPRARTTKSYTEQRSIGKVGPALLVSVAAPAASVGNNFNLFNLNNEPTLYFAAGPTTVNTTNPASGYTGIGTARLKSLLRVPQTTNNSYYAYIYDVSMTGSYTLADATRIYLSADGNLTAGAATGQHSLNILWNGATGNILFPNDSGMLFALPKGERLSQIDRVNYATTNFSSLSVNGANNAGTIQTSGLRQTFPFTVGQKIEAASQDLFILSSTGAPVGFTAVAISSTVLVVTANSPNTSVYAFYTTDMGGNGTNYLKRSKELLTETLIGATASVQTDIQTGRKFLYVGAGSTAYCDVVSILSMTGTLNGSATRSQVLNYFTLDNGQRDNIYDWSRLVFAQNAYPSDTAVSSSLGVGITGVYDITITRFQHTGNSQGPFTIDSYSCDYKDIPVYISPTTGKAYRLSDVLDFRPSKTFNNSLTGHIVPMTLGVANDNKFDYTHYLPRTDKIVLSKDRNFKVLTGVPSIEPFPPSDDPDAMTLYNITLNGYTIDKDDVQIKRIENKRYTMQDIAQLEDRLDSVEYFTNLSMLEQQTKNSPILDSDGVEIPKKGILADSFRGHSVSDVQNSMFSASIDFENGIMRPSFRNRVYKMNTIQSASNVIGSEDGIYTINYTTTPRITQPLATSSMNVNPSGVFNYLGFIRSTPSSDFWYDDASATTVKINTEGENDAWAFGNPLGTGPGEAKGFGTQWNDWESNWSGISRTNVSISDNLNPSRSIFVNANGTRLSTPSSVGSTLPDSIINTNGNLQIRGDIVPYARDIGVSLSAKNMKPNTTVYLFVDGIRVYANGEPGTPIVTDSSGSATVNFSITPRNFFVGKKNIRLTDSSENDLLFTTTAADCVLPIQGTWGNFKDGIVSTRTVQTRRESVKSEKIVTNIFGKAIQRSSFTKLVGYTDPLSQTFYVDPTIYPSGLFAKKITLFFKKKDSRTNTPISLTLKPVINGYPHPSKYIPLSDVTIISQSVNTNEFATTGTDFVFSSPIYLAPGEYAFSITTPSNSFELYTSQIGSSVIKQTTSEETVRATKQPYIRSIFKNQTSSGLQKIDTEDIKFLLHICEFNMDDTSVLTVENTPSGYYGSTVNTDAIRFNIPAVSPPNTELITTDSSFSFDRIDLNKTVELTSRNTSNASVSFSTMGFRFSTNDRFVSPIVDLDRANVNLIENRINQPSGYPEFRGETGHTNLYVPSEERYTSRYITKRVILEPGMEAANLRVEVLASNPAETDFAIFARMSPENGTGLPFDLREYKRMTPELTYPSTQVGEYQEMSFSLTGQPDFRVFSVKIVMTSAEETIVPKFKNLRITAA